MVIITVIVALELPELVAGVNVTVICKVDVKKAADVGELSVNDPTLGVDDDDIVTDAVCPIGFDESSSFTWYVYCACPGAESVPKSVNAAIDGDVLLVEAELVICTLNDKPPSISHSSAVAVPPTTNV